MSDLMTPPRGQDAESLAGASTGELRDLLGGMVVSSVLPRLKSLAARNPRREVVQDDKARSLTDAGQRIVTTRDVDRLVALVTRGGQRAARVFIDGLLAHGCNRAAIFSDLMGPAARRLGERWLEDESSFTEVTIGVAHLQAMLRELALPLRPDARRAVLASILLAPWPGEQHNFGVSLVEEFFHSAGWRVLAPPSPDLAELEAQLAGSRFDMLGLSLSCEHSLPALAEGIGRLRRASANPALVVLVGGAPFAHNPDLVTLVGADATAPDGAAAVARGHQLVAQRKQAVDETRRLA